MRKALCCVILAGVAAGSIVVAGRPGLGGAAGPGDQPCGGDSDGLRYGLLRVGASQLPKGAETADAGHARESRVVPRSEKRSEDRGRVSRAARCSGVSR